MFNNWITWAVIAMVLLIAEIISPTVFFFACLGLGSIVASVSTLFGIYWLPWVAFIVFSFIFVIISRPLSLRLTKATSRPANIDALINKKAYVLEDILSQKYGRVKVEGEEWLAESDEEIEKGQAVTIVSVEGVKLKVKKSS